MPVTVGAGGGVVVTGVGAVGLDPPPPPQATANAIATVVGPYATSPLITAPRLSRLLETDLPQQKTDHIDHVVDLLPHRLSTRVAGLRVIPKQDRIH